MTLRPAATAFPEDGLATGGSSAWAQQTAGAVVELTTPAPVEEPTASALVELTTPATVEELRRALEEARSELEAVRAEAARTERERRRLADRVREVETWVDSRAAFEETEQLQLGRLLAARASERAERQLGIVSLRLLLFAVYVAGMATFGWMVLGERL